MGTSGLKDYIVSRNKFTNDKGCWLTQERYNSNYRNCYYNKETINLHILSAIAFLGHTRFYGIICHKCDIKGCFNPEHLFIGTAKSNHADAISKGRKGRPGFNQVPVYQDFIENFTNHLNKLLDLIFENSELCQ